MKKSGDDFSFLKGRTIKIIALSIAWLMISLSLPQFTLAGIINLQPPVEKQDHLSIAALLLAVGSMSFGTAAAHADDSRYVGIGLWTVAGPNGVSIQKGTNVHVSSSYYLNGVTDHLIHFKSLAADGSLVHEWTSNQDHSSSTNCYSNPTCVDDSAYASEQGTTIQYWVDLYVDGVYYRLPQDTSKVYSFTLTGASISNAATATPKTSAAQTAATKQPASTTAPAAIPGTSNNFIFSKEPDPDTPVAPNSQVTIQTDTDTPASSISGTTIHISKLDSSGNVIGYTDVEGCLSGVATCTLTLTIDPNAAKYQYWAELSTTNGITVSNPTDTAQAYEFSVSGSAASSTWSVSLCKYTSNNQFYCRDGTDCGTDGWVGGYYDTATCNSVRDALNNNPSTTYTSTPGGACNVPNKYQCLLDVNTNMFSVLLCAQTNTGTYVNVPQQTQLTPTPNPQTCYNDCRQQYGASCTVFVPTAATSITQNTMSQYVTNFDCRQAGGNWCIRRTINSVQPYCWKGTTQCQNANDQLDQEGSVNVCQEACQAATYSSYGGYNPYGYPTTGYPTGTTYPYGTTNPYGTTGYNPSGIPVAVCTSGNPMTILGASVGGNVAQQVQVQPRMLNNPGLCPNKGDSCWCTQFAVGTAVSGIGSGAYGAYGTTYGSGIVGGISPVIPGTAGTPHWTSPNANDNPPQAKVNDFVCDDVSNVKLVADFDSNTTQARTLHLYPGGKPVTITGQLAAFSNTCKGYSYDCETPHEYSCDFSSGFFKDTWKYQKFGGQYCPSGQTRLHAEGAGSKWHIGKILTLAAMAVLTAASMGAFSGGFQFINIFSKAGFSGLSTAGKAAVAGALATLAIAPILDGCGPNMYAGAVAANLGAQTAGAGGTGATSSLASYCDSSCHIGVVPLDQFNECLAKCQKTLANCGTGYCKSWGSSCNSGFAETSNTCETLNGEAGACCVLGSDTTGTGATGSGAGTNTGAGSTSSNMQLCESKTLGYYCNPDCGADTFRAQYTDSASCDVAKNTLAKNLPVAGTCQSPNYCNTACNDGDTEIGQCASFGYKCCQPTPATTAQPTPPTTDTSKATGNVVAGGPITGMDMMPVPSTGGGGVPSAGGISYANMGAAMIGLIAPGLACRGATEQRVCYSVCGTDYTTAVAAAPICNKGGAVVDYHAGTYSCSEGSCGGFASQEVTLDITYPDGIKDTKTRATDSDGKFSYTLTAPNQDGLVTVVLSAKKPGGA